MQVENSSFVILVVDDDDLVRVTLTVLVSSLGYTTLAAESAEQALEIINDNKVDLVLTDVVMPGMDGLELLAIIWQNNKDIDVIVTTGFADRTNYVDAVAAGAIDFIKKPISQRELDVKLVRAFRERCLLRELALVAGTDELTGLPDYTTFIDDFSKELERSFRQKNQMHLALFAEKEMSDSVLVELTNILKRSIREDVDQVFRYSEDEFALILPETNADQAAEIVQRVLLDTLERGMGISLAVGLVSCLRDENVLRADAEFQVIEKAKDAVADSRSEGGNVVVCRVL